VANIRLVGVAVTDWPLAASCLAVAAGLIVSVPPALSEPAPSETVAPASTSTPPATVQPLTVQAQSHDYRRGVDRRSYRIAGDLHGATGSVADVLRDLPSVDVDPQGAVSIRGDKNVTILIDGRPSPLFQGPASGSVLEQLPAGQFDRVEVMTSPSAAFDPQGSGGIINLISKKPPKDTLTGSLALRAAVAGRSGANIEGSYAGDRFSTSADAAIETAETRPAEEAALQFVNPTPGEAARASTTSGDRVEDTLESLSASTTYDFSQRRTVSITADAYGLQGRTADTTSYLSETSAGGVVQGYRATIDASSDARAIFASARSTRESDTDDSQATADLQIGDTTNDRRSSTLYSYTAPSIGHVAQSTSSRSGNGTGDLLLEYKSKRPSGVTLDVGYSLDVALDAFDRDGSVSGDTVILELQPAFLDRFRWNQVINAAYVTYEKPVGRFEFMAGLRLEEVTWAGADQTLEFTNSSTYFKYYPSLNLSYQLDSQRQFTASYARRVNRPFGDQLDPFRIYLGPQSFMEGNPNLKPSLTDDLEFGYERQQRDDVFSVDLYFKDTRGELSPVAEELGDGVVLTTTENIGRTREAGAEASILKTLSRSLTASLTGDVKWERIDSPGVSLIARRADVEENLKGRLDWKATSADLVQIALESYSRQLTAQGYSTPYWFLDLGFRHKLSDRLAVEVVALDPLDTSGYQTIVQAPTLTTATRLWPHVRSVAISLNYILGGGPRGSRRDEFDYNQGVSPPH
jgi:outer membrane receptor protein involved in Fe transport